MCAGPLGRHRAGGWRRGPRPATSLGGSRQALNPTSAISGTHLDDPLRRRERITAELHRLEHTRAEYLAARLGPLTPVDRVFDASCGRGGGSVVAHLSYGCHADRE
ncbi:hypothetical protein AQI94_20075 [Streptomyces pseudovenezuelae]|uniref:Uncharacterized protein n=1 Tax=Streptomyces pseudovenezuelae TaxID=67350 RepID=A0A101N5A5_9ACTN|nr:hypothetical protein AQI94_20075 [Streptomyces pseudovenezuelae]